MTTPRVTEIPIVLAAVEPDPLLEVTPRPATAQQRLGDRGSRERQVEMVRRVMQVRKAFTKDRRPA